MTKRTKKPTPGEAPAANSPKGKKANLRPPWKPGQSGNPKGKPKGARNKATLAAQALLDGEAEELARKAVEMALGFTFTEQKDVKLRDVDGGERVEVVEVERVMPPDTTALRLCLERLVPPCREAPVTFDVPEIAAAADAVKAMGALLQAVAEGSLTPTQGTALAGMIETFRRTLETEDLARRLALIEERDGR